MKRRRSLYARPEIVRGQQCAEARLHVERCCAAAQAARRTCRHRGAVIGCRAPQTLQPQRGSGRPAGAAVVVAVEDVRTPATPFVALSAVRTSVHLVAWTSGVQASGVQATGVIQVSGQPGVRCPWPLRPRCPDRAASRTSVPQDRPRLADRGSTCRCGPRAAWSSLPESGLAGTDGRTLAVRGRHECRRQTWAAASQSHRLQRRARRLADQGSWSSARVPVGWLGSTARSRCSQVSPHMRLGQVAGVMLDHGLDRKVMTTLGGR
jgi:hypothetical protein